MRVLGRYRRDEGGAAAVEAALTLPVVFFLLLGVLALTHAYLTDRRLALAASTLADLVTRLPPTGTTKAELEDLFAAGAESMRPHDVTPATLRVTCVENEEADGTDDYRVAWSYEWSGATGLLTPASAPGLLPGTETTMWEDTDYIEAPRTFISEGRMACIAQVEYDYVPPYGDLVFQPMTMRTSHVRSPRNERVRVDVCPPGCV